MSTAQVYKADLKSTMCWPEEMAFQILKKISKAMALLVNLGCVGRGCDTMRVPFLSEMRSTGEPFRNLKTDTPTPSEYYIGLS